ncbi:MAG: Gfo/Idh/MocA family oxidoreductase [Chitinophagaceae bacterium]|nr:Gfo/Idh/MocA family oxidoreductase [Chitinophagaceae bacterium]
MVHKRLIEKYKSLRKQSYLNTLGKYRFQYAFAGVGHHSISNLYPCLESLRVPLKFIYSRNLSNAEKFSHHFNGCIATADIQDILTTPEVKGMFICTEPSQHFPLLMQAMQAGKHVFIEKPPCRTLSELKDLIKVQGNNICMVALQRRFSTINRLLKRYHLTRKASTYVYRYCTGAYPEGDPITELFIHPIDNAVQLFGDLATLETQKIDHGNGISFHLLVKHVNDVQGMIQLSTAYSWAGAFETLEINTTDHIVYANYPNELKTIEKSGTLLKIPKEKVWSGPEAHKIYFSNSGFVPGATDNSFIVQGFYPEIKHFLSLTESGKNDHWGSIASLYTSYSVMDQLALADKNGQAKKEF